MFNNSWQGFSINGLFTFAILGVLVGQMLIALLTVLICFLDDKYEFPYEVFVYSYVFVGFICLVSA